MGGAVRQTDHHSAARQAGRQAGQLHGCVWRPLRRENELLDDCYAFDLATYSWVGPARALPRRYLFCYQIAQENRSDGRYVLPVQLAGAADGHSMISAIAPSNFSSQNDCFHWTKQGQNEKTYAEIAKRK